MLRDVLDRVRRDRRTLTLFTRDGPDEGTASVRRHFAVRNVEVRVRETEPPQPTGFAVLHDDDGHCVEAGALSTLADYLSPDVWEQVFDVDRSDERPAPPALLHAVDDGVYVVEESRRLPLLRASHQIEHLATNSNPGRLFAGFQKLSNLKDSSGTWNRYRRLAEHGTDVHVFGEADQQLPAVESLTLHSPDAAEISDTWFLVYLGAEWSGVLIAEQVSSGEDGDRYDGFFSFRRDLAETTAAYLGETYLDESDLARPVADDGGTDCTGRHC